MRSKEEVLGVRVQLLRLQDTEEPTGDMDLEDQRAEKVIEEAVALLFFRIEDF